MHEFRALTSTWLNGGCANWLTLYTVDPSITPLIQAKRANFVSLPGSCACLPPHLERQMYTATITDQSVRSAPLVAGPLANKNSYNREGFNLPFNGLVAKLQTISM